MFYFSFPACLVISTSELSSFTSNPANWDGINFTFCAFFSAMISSAKNSTNSFSAEKCIKFRGYMKIRHNISLLFYRLNLLYALFVAFHIRMHS